VVGAAHEEAHARPDRAVPADDEALGTEAVEDGVGLELGRALRVVVVGEVADLDLRAAHERLQEDDAILAGDGVRRARIGAHADEYPG
jgi:hypothetical protein